jgi:hypothetical protein
MEPGRQAKMLIGFLYSRTSSRDSLVGAEGGRASAPRRGPARRPIRVSEAATRERWHRCAGDGSGPEPDGVRCSCDRMEAAETNSKENP